MGKYQSTKIIELGSTAFRQPKAKSHCKYVHGYRLIAKIWVAANELDENNWVFDFGSFKELTNTLQKTFDHKLVIDKNDPAKSAFRELERYGAVDIVEMEGVGIEKFAEYVFNQTDTFVKFITNNRVWCEKVEVFEHEKNSAIYIKELTPKIENFLKKDNVIYTSEEESKKETPSPNINQTPQPAPSPEVNKSVKPAPLTNKVTTGWGNPFAGTSWGA